MFLFDFISSSEYDFDMDFQRDSFWLAQMLSVFPLVRPIRQDLEYHLDLFLVVSSLAFFLNSPPQTLETSC